MAFNGTQTLIIGWAAVGGACVTLGACQVPNTNPAAVCAAPQTAERLTSVAFSGLRLHPGDARILIDAPTLTSFDSTTKKRTCSANLSLAFGGSLAGADPNKGKAALEDSDQVASVSGQNTSQLLTGPQEYSIQPSADGKGLVYAMSRQLVEALQAWVLASKATANQISHTAPSARQDTSNSATTSTATDQPGTETRFGNLEVSEDNRVLFNGSSLDPSVNGNNSISLSNAFNFGSKDLVIAYDEGGDACPEQLAVIVVDVSGARSAGQFGTCAEGADVEKVGNELQIKMKGYVGPEASESEKTAAEAERHQFNVDSNGQVFENGKAVKLAPFLP